MTWSLLVSSTTDILFVSNQRRHFYALCVLNFIYTIRQQGFNLLNPAPQIFRVRVVNERAIIPSGDIGTAIARNFRVAQPKIICVIFNLYSYPAARLVQCVGSSVQLPNNSIFSEIGKMFLCFIGGNHQIIVYEVGKFLPNKSFQLSNCGLQIDFGRQKAKKGIN